MWGWGSEVNNDVLMKLVALTSDFSSCHGGGVEGTQKPLCAVEDRTLCA